MSRLLLLVDLQADYLRASGLEPCGDALVARVARLLVGCRTAGVPVAHVWTTVAESPDRRLPHWKARGDWRCRAGSPGHEPPAALAPVAGEAVIHKSGYSAFADGTLRSLLQGRGVDTLILAGVHLHACVRQAAIDAVEEGLAVWIAEDAVASDDPLHAALTRRYLAARAVRFAPADAVLPASAAGTPWQPEPEERRHVAGAVAEAAAACRRAQRPTVDERCRWLESAAGRLTAGAAELAGLLADEIGKPIRFGRIEIERSAEMLHAVARRFRAATWRERGPGSALLRVPHGVVAVVTPWNNPAYIPLGKIAPALACGNAVVWKPAPESATIARALGDLLAAAGVPDGLVRVVPGGADVARQVLEHEAVAAASLTGSSAAGWSAQEICARRRIPLQAELGGNNAALVWADADLDHAAREIAAGAFDQAGQRCTANRRVVVHAEVCDRFVAALTAAASGLPWGDPRRPETRIGPVVSARHRDRIEETVARAVAAGCRTVYPHGVGPPEPRGHWTAPAILRADDPAAEIVQEESFGPVLVVQRAESWEEAIGLVNGVRQGLVAALFARSEELRERFRAQAAAGILKIGRSTADADVDVPFGGWKASGLGPPEHGAYDLEFHTRPQVVYDEGDAG